MLRTPVLNRLVPVFQPKLGRFLATSIRDTFDKKSESSNRSWFKSAETGLFLNPYLKSPAGFKKFSKDSLAKAQVMVDDMIANPDNFVLKLDRLSDVLCRVIDLCEFVRSCHPNSKYASAANECYEQMFEYMNTLNTNVALCNRLKEVMEEDKRTHFMAPDERKVGEILLEDFEKSGVYNEDNQFIELSQQIQVWGQSFAEAAPYAATDYVLVDKSPALEKYNLSTSGGKYKVPMYNGVAYSIIRECSDPDVRSQVWTALHSCPDEQIHKLETVLKLRALLANKMGFSSFAEYQLKGKMAKNPENVVNFLHSLVRTVKPGVDKELAILAQQGDTTTVAPWDREFLVTKYKASLRSQHNEHIKSYLSLGVVMEGLSNLFSNIYGIKFVPRDTLDGETWHQDVRRLDVVANDQLIGVIYCDLFSRPGKTPNPAHFTVCCSRKLHDETPDQTIQVGHQGDDTFQLPIISLVCDFATGTGTPPLLTLSEVETLFHEMGHAMHSMLGRTNFQNISGTRCATDFVEFPSILMEHFARDPRVIKSFARHYRTNEPIPDTLFASYQRDNDFLNNLESMAQIKMSLLDQVLHSEHVSENMRSLNVVDVYHRVEESVGVLVDNKSNWPGKFGHLFGYGASYYSYLFDRALASLVWEHLFAEDPFNREQGEKLIQGILKWGGSKNPWEMLADVLDKPELAKGDEIAMEYIGSSLE